MSDAVKLLAGSPSAKLDQLLRDAPIPALPDRSGVARGATDDASWDEHADQVVARAKGAAKASSEELNALLAPPVLDPEPGEHDAAFVSRAAPAPSAVRNVGVTKMSESDRPKPSQRRPSLKELAERVSKTPPPSSVAPASSRPGAAPLSAPPSAGPGPSSVQNALATPLPGPTSTATPLPLSAPPAATRLPIGDRIGAPPASTQAPLSAQPASMPATAPASAAAPVIPIEMAKKPVAQKQKGGGMAGLLIAGIGIAAAAGLFFFLGGGKFKPSPPKADTPAEVVTATASPTEEVPEPEADGPKPEGTGDSAIDLAQLPDGSASTGVTAPVPGPLGPLAGTEPVKPKEKDPFVPNPDGTLDEAMRDAAGNPIKKADGPQPASEDNTPKNVPDQPPQGAISAYVGSVMGGAKACVAGADEPSRATVTVSSSGKVTSVSVGGWAAGKSAASCIQNALKGGSVAPFSKPSYSFGVNIRP